jgi:hypothetical protein
MMHQCGFSVAFYGSVLLDGESNDLDMFMVPQRENPDMASLLDTIRRHLRDVRRRKMERKLICM